MEVTSTHNNNTAVVLQVADPERQESLVEDNTPDALDAEQTWPTDDELKEAAAGAPDGGARDDPHERAIPNPFTVPRRTKRVPKGTSSYQAAWILDSGSEDDDGDAGGNEDGEVDEEAMEGQEGGGDDRMRARAADDDDDGSDDESEQEYEEVVVDEDLNALDTQLTEHEEKEQLSAYLNRKASQLADDLQFPDEVDTPLDTPALMRFAKYRGLQSFQKSPWDPYENLPSEYGRIFDFADFKRTHRRALTEDGGVSPFSYISLVVAGVPVAYLSDWHEARAAATGPGVGVAPHRSLPSPELPVLPLVAYGLLPHENKTSVLHFTVLRHALSGDAIVRSKDPLVLQAAFRRWDVQPIFSEHTLGDKHKFERFLQSGRTSVATVYGPTTFPPTPMLLFRENGDGAAPTLIGTGSLLEVQPRRVITKRIVLTGSIFKINKRTATIRYMFFNREDVAWFKPVQLRTKGGRIGNILGPLGTHGYMKCQFDGPLRAEDVICMFLYKRVFPKWKAQLHRRAGPRMLEHVVPATEADGDHDDDDDGEPDADAMV